MMLSGNLQEILLTRMEQSMISFMIILRDQGILQELWNEQDPEVVVDDNEGGGE